MEPLSTSTCNGQATRITRTTSASRRHFCTRTWVHKCLPFLMAGVPVEPVEPIGFHLTDSVRFVFEVRIGWLLALNLSFCCETIVHEFTSSLWPCVSFLVFAFDPLLWPKRFGPEKAKHRGRQNEISRIYDDFVENHMTLLENCEITASIVPWHVFSSPLQQVPRGLRPLEPFTKSGVSPNANNQYLTPWVSNDMQIISNDKQ